MSETTSAMLSVIAGYVFMMCLIIRFDGDIGKAARWFFCTIGVVAAAGIVAS